MKKKIVYLSLILISIFLLSFFQNCGDVKVSKELSTTIQSSKICSDFETSKPENIYDDASTNPDQALFKIHEITANQQLISSERIFDWYVENIAHGSSRDLQLDITRLEECHAYNITAELKACDETYQWKKSYMKAGPRCPTTTTTTTSTTTSTTNTTLASAKVSCDQFSEFKGAVEPDLKIDCTKPMQALVDNDPTGISQAAIGGLGCDVQFRWNEKFLGGRILGSGDGHWLIEYIPGPYAGTYADFWGNPLPQIPGNSYWTFAFAGHKIDGFLNRKYVKQLEVSLSTEPNDFSSANVIYKRSIDSQPGDQIAYAYNFRNLIYVPHRFTKRLYINSRPSVTSIYPSQIPISTSLQDPLQTWWLIPEFTDYNKDIILPKYQCRF